MPTRTVAARTALGVATTWVQGRVNRLLRHTYTRQPRDFGGEIVDEWGDPITQFDVGDAVSGVRCLFIDGGTYILGPGGPIQVEDNTLCVANDDSLSLGDVVTDVLDPATGRNIYPGPGTVRAFTDVASGGPVLYRYARLQEAEAT